MTLQDKVAIVTGASREIGAAMALELAKAGVSVLVAHYNEPELAAATVARIAEVGGRAIVYDTDLSSVAANQRMVARAVEAFGRLDILAANAGITASSPFLETTEQTWDTLVGLNLKGSFFGAQAAARQMIAQGEGGRIIFSSSVTGIRSVPNLSAYGITKAGLRHMAVTLGVELGRYGITVNALGIGATVNERNMRDDPDYSEHWATVIPTARALQPLDLAAALMFLVSPAAAMVNGHTLVVDGGWTLNSPIP